MTSVERLTRRLLVDVPVGSSHQYGPLMVTIDRFQAFSNKHPAGLENIRTHPRFGAASNSWGLHRDNGASLLTVTLYSSP
jgi:hypothetical protein